MPPLAFYRTPVLCYFLIMGARGPAPKTSVEPLDPNAFNGDMPPPPPDMSPEGVAEFKRIAEIGGSHYTAADYQTIIDFVELLEKERAIHAEIEWPHATLVSTRTGATYVDPRYSIWSSLRKARFALAQKLGMNPTDRARLLGGVASKPAENPLLAEIRSAQKLKAVANG